MQTNDSDDPNYQPKHLKTAIVIDSSGVRVQRGVVSFFEDDTEPRHMAKQPAEES